MGEPDMKKGLRLVHAGLEFPDWFPTNNYSDPSLAAQKFLFDQTGLTNPQTLVPRTFNNLLDSSNIPQPRRLYWWRCQVSPESQLWIMPAVLCHAIYCC